MIGGRVSIDLVPIVKLVLVGVGAEEVEIEAEVDTGFNSALSLPIERIRSLGWIYVGNERTVFGDGRAFEMELFRGIVLWEGQPRLISVMASPSVPLLGTALLEGSELRIQFKRGGDITITALA